MRAWACATPSAASVPTASAARAMSSSALSAGSKFASTQSPSGRRSPRSGRPTPIRSRRKSCVPRWSAIERRPLCPASPPPTLSSSRPRSKSPSSWTTSASCGAILKNVAAGGFRLGFGRSLLAALALGSLALGFRERELLFGRLRLDFARRGSDRRDDAIHVAEDCHAFGSGELFESQRATDLHLGHIDV